MNFCEYATTFCLIKENYMFEFFDFSNWHFYAAIILSAINAVILCFEGYKFLQVIQLSGYHTRGYFDWLKGSGGAYVGRLAMVAILSIACMLVTNVILDNYGEYLSYLGLVFYFLFSYIYVINVHLAPKKTPLKLTNRMNRAIILLFIICFIISMGFIVLSSMYLDFLRFAIVGITPLLLPVLVPFVHWILKPLEAAINRGYVKRAEKKLTQFPNLIKIGITGSFGKTSTKNFLATILSEKYSVCATPFNFNTPMGITKTVLQTLSLGHQVFIAEMGARQTGDIKELCEIVEPKYGILTSIGAQHIATFKSLENVKKTKAELPIYLEKDGFCVFNMDSEPVVEIEKTSKCRKCTVSITNKADIYATDISTSSEGTHFKLHIGDKVLECSTRLLGLHNISNLLLCVAMARELKLTDEQILSGISKVAPVEHRLQLINAENDVIILDDTYNASIEGSQRALEVLSMFDDRRKIVITPGLVELGTMERLENYNFGARISKVADIVIIVNKSNYLSIRQGLLDNGFDETKIYEAENLYATNDIMKDILMPKDVILWENDLPDNYI